MNRERFVRMRDIFVVACELEAGGRSDFLDVACADDRDLRCEIDELFAQESNSQDRRLAVPAVRSSLVGHFDPAKAARAHSVPESIGAFRIIDKIGEGGMGVVYRAEQEHPRRTVALKVMRESMSAALLSRFRREADLLARLEHPGIARVFEAGVGEVRIRDGPADRQPFFAMELIDGTPLTDYASSRQLSQQARLELLAKVCDAVHHAHCRGVIHRDLKPSNILVVEEIKSTVADELSGSSRSSAPSCVGAYPKVLDFGISRAIDDRQTRTLCTETGQVIGTIAYASPEQLEGDSATVDVRSDVYSLGVILYELLAGRLPIEVGGLGLAQAVRRIIESDPAPIATLKPELSGDVAAILAKALEKERERRYSSAAALAEDIRRHLRDEPIAARPITAMYSISKFVRRHRKMVAAFAMALVGGIGGLTYGLLTARFERDVARAAESRAVAAGLAEQAARETAQREARTAAAVNQFLNEDLLAAASPDNTPDRDIRMRDVLDQAARKIEGRFKDEPLVESAVRATLGKTYLRLGEYGEAQAHLNRALALRTQHLAPTDTDLVDTLTMVAQLLYHQGRYVEAERGLADVFELCRNAYGEDHPLTVNTMGDLGFVRLQLQKFAEAEPLLLESLERQRRLAPRSAVMVGMLVNLGMCYMRTNRDAQAEVSFRDAVDLAGSALGADHPDTLNALVALGAIHNQCGDFDRAVPLIRSTIEAQARVLGGEHPQTLVSRANLGFAYLRSEQFDEAEPVIEQVLAARQSALGEGHPHTLTSLLQLGILRKSQGRLAEAEELLRYGMDLQTGLPGDAKPGLSAWVQVLADVSARRKTCEANALRAQRPE